MKTRRALLASLAGALPALADGETSADAVQYAGDVCRSEGNEDAAVLLETLARYLQDPSRGNLEVLSRGHARSGRVVVSAEIQLLGR